LKDYDTIDETEKENTIFKEALDEIENSMSAGEIIRKDLLSLKQEKMTRGQWLLVLLLTATIVISITFNLPSQNLFIASALKSSFVLAVIFSVMLLKGLDDLTLYESQGVGQSSAVDLLKIIERNEEKNK
jgi:hypothetical protein